MSADEKQTILTEMVDKVFVRLHPGYENDFGGGPIWRTRPGALKECLLEMARRIEALEARTAAAAAPVACSSRPPPHHANTPQGDRHGKRRQDHHNRQSNEVKSADHAALTGTSELLGERVTARAPLAAVPAPAPRPVRGSDWTDRAPTEPPGCAPRASGGP